MLHLGLAGYSRDLSSNHIPGKSSCGYCEFPTSVTSPFILHSINTYWCLLHALQCGIHLGYNKQGRCGLSSCETYTRVGRQTIKHIGVWRHRMLQGSKATTDKVKRCRGGSFSFLCVCMHVCMYVHRHMCSVCECVYACVAQGWCLESSWISPLSNSLRQGFLKW